MKKRTDWKAFDFIKISELPEKPREEAVTEIRGTYYTVVGERYLEDLLKIAGEYVDGFKFTGGTQRLFNYNLAKRIIKLCHDFDVYVSTGGFLERVLIQGPKAVAKFLEENSNLEFDVVEISSGFIDISLEDKIALVKDVKKLGMKPKPEISLVAGTGGGVEGWETTGISPNAMINEAKAHLKAGAWKVMIESEGITEGVKIWRTDVIKKISTELNLKNVMFEAAERPVFRWYVYNFGPKVNLFVDHSQIMELTALRTGLWAPKESWGKVKYRGK